ncbi:MAG TPA: vitamin K epoxide reductase family protein [Pyrinomonadaceae bacterium]|nr:vitamin K epoxide reductase family protein [Pyrinomonadaceae bacterium]
MTGADVQTQTAATKSFKLFVLIACVALVGLADAVYLTVQHITGQSVRCTIVSGCSEVLSSSYSSFNGVPLALIGAAAYFTVFSLAILAAFGYPFVMRMLMVVVGLMFLTTLRLLYLQAFVIGHFCQFCLLSALVTTVLTGLVIMLLRRH